MTSNAAPASWEVRSTVGITDLLDIRHTPISRKRGFSKAALAEALSAAGIRYHHVKALGAPKELRMQLKESGDFDSFASAYRAHLRANRSSLDAVVTMAKEGKSCMMCVEPDQRQCHRGLISAVIEARPDAADVVHL